MVLSLAELGAFPSVHVFKSCLQHKTHLVSEFGASLIFAANFRTARITELPSETLSRGEGRNGNRGGRKKERRVEEKRRRQREVEARKEEKETLGINVWPPRVHTQTCSPVHMHADM